MPKPPDLRTGLRLDRAAGRLWDEAGRLFEPGRCTWEQGGGVGAAAGGPPRGEAIGAEDAVRWLQTESGSPCRVPVGVIGPRAAEPRQLEVAERLGARLAALGLAVLCGGREGVMEAVCRGVAGVAGGVSIGLLPDDTWETANPHVTVALATGIGEARNAVIARASLCLIAVGGSYGTLAEVALGLRFGRPVFGLEGAPEVPGLIPLGSVDDACGAVARVVLGLDRP